MTRIAVTIQHPAHVHFFRHAIDQLHDGGHEVHVYAREKDVALRLLDAYEIPYTVLAGGTGSTLGLAAIQIAYELRLLRALRALDPDVVTAIGGVAAAHVAPLVGARSVVFTDNEGVASNRLVAPFAHAVCTPAWFDGEFGPSHRRYRGCHELAYLHPDRFSADTNGLRDLGIEPEEPYSVLRFVAWRAHHDIGHRGLSSNAKRELLNILEEHGDVYITTEARLSRAFEPYRLPVPPHRLHDLLAHADLYVGDSQTMATEAGVLATPSIRVNSFVGDGDMTNFRELESRGLVNSFADEDRALARVRALIGDPEARSTWRKRRDQFVEESVDVTDYIVTVLEEEARQVGGEGPLAAVTRRLPASGGG